MDVSFWYLIKIFHPFVYVEIAAGVLKVACFGIMLLVTMYRMWFSSAPAMVAERLETLG